ncbi:agglutinin biogenesis protein MshI [Thiobacter aerophilum]|uniref:Agglutinin biogenesis protein MshI n=1 Tax=Thiobacter aerophilum TaxID=3121275 RepID=A0ABV0EF63_9BURK
MTLAFSGDEVLLAHCEPRNGAKPLVTVCGSLPAPRDDVAALARLAREMRLAEYRVSVLLGLDQYQMMVVEAPGVPPEELKVAVRWRVKDMLDYHIDDATLDILTIPPGPSGGTRAQSLYVVAARNEVIAGYITRCQQAGIPLSVIDIPEMASRNLASLVAQPGRGVAMLAFSNEGGLFTVSHEGELYLARHLEVTLDDLANGGVREAHFERITLEVQRSLDYVERQFGFVAVAHLWLAPNPVAQALREHLAGNLYLPVSVLDLGEILDFSRVPELAGLEAQTRFFLPLGGSLRHEVTAL